MYTKVINIFTLNTWETGTSAELVVSVPMFGVDIAAQMRNVVWRRIGKWPERRLAAYLDLFISSRRAAEDGERVA